MDRLGLDIGTVSVKYLRWRGKKGKGSVISSGSFPYTNDYDNLANILDDIVLKEGYDLDVSITFTSQDIQKRIFTIPIMPKSELNEALKWSASKTTSIPLDEMVYEFTILGDVDERGTKKQEVLLTCIDKSNVRNLMSVVTRTGFKKISLLTDTAFTYVSAVERDEKNSIAVIDIGGRQSGIYIFDERKLRFVREIMTASESFTDALMSGLNLSYDDAEKYKRSFGFHDEALSSLSIPLERLSGEIQRTLNVYSQKFPQRPVKKIYITGGGSKIPGFLNKLSEYLIEEIALLSPSVSGIEEEYIPSYIICISPEGMVNLLPDEIKEIERKRVFMKWLRTGTVGVMSILAILSLNVYGKLNQASIGLVSAKNVIEQKKKQYVNISNMAAAGTQYNDFLAIQNEIKKRDYTFITLMKYLSASLPENIHIKDLEFDRYSKIMAGIPKDSIRESLLKDEKTLRESVKLPSITPDSQKDAASALSAKKAQEALEKEYGVKMVGYIYGDVDMVETALMGILVRLQKTGFLRNIDIAQKEIKDMKGQNALEFTLTARCMAYEI